MRLAAGLGPTIRAIRKAHHLTTAEFALELHVDQSMISRYESGKRVPRAPVLHRLLRIAQGAERNPILEQLSIIQGRPVLEEEALRQADLMVAEEAILKREIEIMGDPRPNLARFAYLAPKILLARKEIDESLNTVLELWLAHEPGDPVVRQCFSDAVQYLKLLLAAKVVLRAGHLKGTYRVIMPVDLGDGVTHQHGEILKLDFDTATRYGIALESVEGEPKESIAQSRKKLA
jgi:transcriptional regulator with XRE-family HTH domain